MTELLYQTDAYLKEFTARVAAVDGQRVALDRSAFYATSGGQPHDLGTLSNGAQTWEVTDVRREADNIWHTLSGEGMPAVGDTLTGQIDWQRRYRLMRTHTALHLLCGVVFRDYGALVTGGNMDIEEGRLDFELRDFTPELAQKIVEAVNQEVAADRRVEVRILPREEAFQIPDLIRTKINLLPEGIEQIRTIEIVGLDLQADGGTHVSNTSEVGGIRVTGYESKGRINKRIRIELVDPLVGA